mgnify:CR=1 FL=1
MSWQNLSDSELLSRLSRLPFPRDDIARTLVSRRDEEDAAAVIDEWLGSYE